MSLEFFLLFQGKGICLFSLEIEGDESCVGGFVCCDTFFGLRNVNVIDEIEG